MRAPTSVVAIRASSLDSFGGDDLDQPHQRRRVEEVHADDSLGAGCVDCDCGDRQRGGVAGEDRLRPADPGEIGEEPALQLEVSPAPPPPPVRIRSRSARLAAAPTRSPALSASSSLQNSFRAPFTSAARSRSTPDWSAAGRWIVQAGLVAAERRDLGDAGAHRAGADDSDPLDAHRPLNSGSRFSRKACIPSTRSSVAIASS